MNQTNVNFSRATALFCLSLLIPAAVAGSEAPVEEKKSVPKRPAREGAPAERQDQGEAVRLHLEVIRILLPAEKLPVKTEGEKRRQSLDELAAEALRQGQGEVIYVFDTPVMLGGNEPNTKLRHGSQAPFVTKSSVSSSGQKQDQIQYKDIGCTIELSAQWGEDTSPRRIKASWEVEIADMVSSPQVALTEDVHAPMFVKAALEFGTRTELGSETTFASLSNPAGGEPSGREATAYVCRFQFDEETHE